ncbi:MAG: flippase activity-associated protein Agl23 [Haloarculaceae archaeon]
MATVDEWPIGTGAVTALLDRFGVDRVDLLVADVTLLALLARLYDLGGRVAHWDEARVAYWTMRYVETGNVRYRPIIHGPFYHHVNRLLFEVLGPSDFSMRLVVAVVGGLLPLAALLFRDRLRGVEVVALALFLAVNPVVLYYSRFMRGDPLVAMFMFLAFALFVRGVDVRKTRYAYAAVGAAALGFTVKENALLYLVCWVGAAVVVADHRLLDADRERHWTALVGGHVRWAWRLFKRRFVTVVLLAAEFLAVVVFFYAPRGQTDAGPGLWTAFADPGKAPAVLETATVGAWQDFWGLWVSGGHQDHAYLPYLGDFLQTMGHGALALSLFALVGFAADRYAADGPRDLVQACFVWGFASVLGYPLVTDIMAPWATINAIVPLAVPAAVGVGLLARWTAGAFADAVHVETGLGAFTLAVVAAVVVSASVGAVYLSPQSEGNELVQYAQPAGDVGPLMQRLDAAAADHEGTDVVVVGEKFVDNGDPSVPRKPGCVKWFNALPLPWYFAASDADVTCADDVAGVGRAVDESRPPLVVARGADEQALADALPGYELRTYRLRAWGYETAFFVHEDYVGGLPPGETGR